MRAEFTPAFFLPQPPQLLENRVTLAPATPAPATPAPATPAPATSAPATSALHAMRYDEQRYGSVDAFMRHTDFAQFQQRFTSLIDGMSAFARDHAEQLSPPITNPRLNAVAADLATFKDHLFDAEQDFFSSHKHLVYGVGFEVFEKLARLLQDERIPLQRRMNTVINLARDTTVCAGGCITGLQNAVGVLNTSARGITASAYRFKQQMVESAALNHARRRHRYQPGNEVHYVNAYVNASADALGVVPRPDPFAQIAQPEMTAELTKEFDESVRQALLPITMVRAMTDDYVSQITVAAEASDNIPIAQIGSVKQRIEALQEATLNAEYGPVPLHDFLTEVPADGSYRIAKPPTLVAVRLMERLKSQKIISFEPVVLAKALDGNADLLYVNGLLWLDRSGQHEALNVETLCRAFPQDLQNTLLHTSKLDDKSRQIIFCDIVDAVINLLRANPLCGLPAGWLKNFVDVSPQLTGERTAELTARLLGLAMQFDDGAAMQALLDVGVNKEMRNRESWSLAAHAVAHGRNDVLRILLQRQADIEVKAPGGESVLMLAVRTGSAASVNALLDAGARLDVANDEGKTALMIAAEVGRGEIVALLWGAGAAVDAATPNGITALLLAATHGHADALHRLIAGGADVNAKGISNRTALINAAQYGHIDVLNILLQAQASTELRTYIDQHTALTIAAARGHVAAVSALLAAGAQIDAKIAHGHTALTFAAAHGNNDVIRVLLEGVLLEPGADKEVKTDDGHTALTHAAINGHAETIKLLIAAGADIDTRSHGYTALHLGTTALMEAARAGQHAALIALLAAGASIEARSTDSDYTALMYAAIHDDTEALRLLLDAGALIDASSEFSETALSLAMQDNNNAAVEILLARGAAT